MSFCDVIENSKLSVALYSTDFPKMDCMVSFSSSEMDSSFLLIQSYVCSASIVIIEKSKLPLMAYFLSFCNIYEKNFRAEKKQKSLSSN